MKTKKIVTLTLISALVALPLNTKAVTLGEYEAQVNKYTQEMQNKQNQVKLNDEEIAKIKTEINTIQKQVTETQTEITNLQAEIDKCNKEIEEKKEQTKQLIEYKQLSSGANDYLEYIFGATSITDMIYRMSLVEQMTEYNNKIQTELNQLIETNKKKTEELNKKKTELNELNKQLQEKVAKIAENTKSIKEGMPSTQQQIDTYAALVKKYKAAGCSSSDRIGIDCAVPPKASTGGGSSSGGTIATTGMFHRPTFNSYISCGWYCYSGHTGIDISSANKDSTVIYPIADGEVIYKGKDVYGAWMVKIAHNTGNNIVFSTYVHMKNLYGGYSKGDFINSNTPLGLMGNTGNSFGVHLHLEMASCDWNYNCTWSQYQNSMINPTRYVDLPGSWSNR